MTTWQASVVVRVIKLLRDSYVTGSSYQKTTSLLLRCQVACRTPDGDAEY